MTEDQSVVELLLRDHKKVEAMIGQLEEMPESRLGDFFCQLREELVRHEVAEELIVYPAFRENVPGGDAIADACIAEQSEAEEMLARLDKDDPTTPAFRAQLAELGRAVLAHAEHEQVDVFPALERDTDRSQLEQLGQRYEKALASAPTHPHPHAPDSPPGNTVMGPVAALVDRIRDSMRAA